MIRVYHSTYSIHTETLVPFGTFFILFFFAQTSNRTRSAVELFSAATDRAAPPEPLPVEPPLWRKLRSRSKRGETCFMTESPTGFRFCFVIFSFFGQKDLVACGVDVLVINYLFWLMTSKGLLGFSLRAVEGMLVICWIDVPCLCR